MVKIAIKFGQNHVINAGYLIHTANIKVPKRRALLVTGKFLSTESTKKQLLERLEKIYNCSLVEQTCNTLYYGFQILIFEVSGCINTGEVYLVTRIKIEGPVIRCNFSCNLQHNRA